MKAAHFPIISLFLAFSLLAPAQNQTDPSQTNSSEEQEDFSERNGSKRFWEANVGTGNYMVALDRITSIAKHEYVISNAGTRVVELSIETLGNSLARFYYVEPVGTNAPVGGRIVQRGMELAERAGRRVNQDLNQVTKEYPMTTHSRTVEYRVATEAAVTNLYRSVSKAWKEGKGRIVNAR